MSDQARWYVVHTYSGYENKVEDSIRKAAENRGLCDLICKVRVPSEIVTEVKDSKQREVEHKIFPSYVLVKMVMNDETWYVVRNIRGVTGFVGPGSKPVPLTDEEVSRLGIDLNEPDTAELARERDRGSDEKQADGQEASPVVKSWVEVNYGVGDTVSITDDTFGGMIGTVTSIDREKGVVRLTVSMMGKDVSVELALDKVSLV